MFHVMLVLMALIFGIAFLAILVGILLFAVLAIIAAVVGTTSVALLVKDKLVKKLLFSGFTIIFLAGVACLLPVLMAFAHLSGRIALACALVIGLLTVLSSALGIKNACSLSSKTVRTILIVLFIIVMVTVVGILGSALFYISFVAI